MWSEYLSLIPPTAFLTLLSSPLLYSSFALVFFGCCIAGAAVTLLLPEVKGRDPDLVLAEEIREKRKKAGLDVDVDA